MAYPRYIGKSAFASGTLNNISVGALTGTQAGDIIILFAESANQTIATPTGYSVLATQVGTGTAGAAGAVRIATFYRIMGDAADTATTVDVAGDHTTAIKMLFRDTSLASGNGFFVAATDTQGTASTSMTFPAVTTATDESLVVLGVALDTDANSTATVGAVTNANLANITERHDQTVSSGAGGGLAVITGQKATAGSTGTSTATGSTSVTRAYHTISLSRIAAQTTTSDFKTVSTTTYFPISDAMRITAGASGKVIATSSGTFDAVSQTVGTYALNFKWYWRQYGTDSWTSSTAQASTVSAVVGAGATTGQFVDNETITGLTNGVEYEFVLFAARQSATPTNSISFSATASIDLNYKIIADGSTFSYTGGAANLLDNKLVTADNVTFSYTGGTADLYYNKILSADAGTFSYSGADADILHNKVVAADSATYSYTGSDVNFSLTLSIFADSGSYSYSGTDVNLLAGLKLTADEGSYSYTGTDATFLYNRNLTLDSGSFSYTGEDVAFKVGYVVAADAGVYSYSGNDASLVGGFKLAADEGTFAYSGNTAELLFNRFLSSDSGTYSYTGGDATLTYTVGSTYTLTADAGTYSYSGQTASLLASLKMVADSGNYSYSGNDATLTFSSGLSQIYLGGVNISSLKYGSSTVSKVYLGSTQVFG